MAKVKFDEIARECRCTYKGDKTGVAIVGLEHIVPNEMLVKDYEVDTDNTFTKSFKKGQILFGRRRAYQQKAGVATFDGICSGDITVIEAIAGKVDKDLLPFIIQNERFFEHAVQGSAGSLSPRVKWEHLASYEFDLPSLSEQKILADKLLAAYRLKESYKKLLAATDEMVKSRFIEMFGSISDNNFKFPSKRLGDVCRVINGRAYSAKELLSEGKYRVLRVGNFFSNETWYYSDLELESDKYCNTGDLLFAWSCTLGPKIWTDEKAIFHYHIWKLADYGEKLDKVFFNEQLKQIADKMKHETHGSTMVHLTKNQFESISLIIPPLEAQERFVSIVHQADKSKFELRKSIDAIDAVIKSLINENI